MLLIQACLKACENALKCSPFRNEIKKIFQGGMPSPCPSSHPTPSTPLASPDETAYWCNIQRTRPNIRLILQAQWSAQAGVCFGCFTVIMSKLCHPHSPRVGPGHPSFPVVNLIPLLFPFYFSLSFIGFTYLLLLSIFPFYQNSPTLFPGRRSQEATEPGFSLLCLCYLYSLVKVDSGVLFYLVQFSFMCSFSAFDTVGWVI